MSTIKADTLESATTNGDLTIQGNGTGVPDLESGSKLNGVAFGSAATLTAGTGANNLVQLDGSGNLPAVNGSALTGLTSAGWEHVETVTAAGATTYQIGENNVASGYDYMIVLTEMKFSADPGQDYPALEQGTGAGPTYQTSSYKNARRTTQGGSEQIDGSVTANIPLAIAGTFQWGGDAGDSVSFIIYIGNPGDGSYRTNYLIHGFGDDSSTTFAIGECGAHHTGLAAITGWNFILDGVKTFDTGTFKLYRRPST